MIVAIDTRCVRPDLAGPVERHTAELIEAVRRSPTDRLVLLTRPETHDLFAPLTDRRTRVGPASEAWSADVVHYPGNTIRSVDTGVPAVLTIHDLRHRRTPDRFTPDERGRRETWWTASAHRAAAIVVPADHVRDDLHRQLGVPTANVFVAAAELGRTLSAAYAHAVREHRGRRAA